MTNTKALIISSVEKVTKISDENVNDKYCFNGKEIEANEDNKAKITKAINKIVNRYISQYENTLVLTGAGCSILSKTDFTTYDISE